MEGRKPLEIGLFLLEEKVALILTDPSQFISNACSGEEKALLPTPKPSLPVNPAGQPGNWEQGPCSGEYTREGLCPERV